MPIHLNRCRLPTAGAVGVAAGLPFALPATSAAAYPIPPKTE